MRFLPGRWMVAIAIGFILLTSIALPTSWRTLVSAKTTSGKQQLAQARELRRDRQEELLAALQAEDPQNFRQSLTTLTTLDEPGALKVWQAALQIDDPQLKREVWAAYQNVRLKLERKELIPQLARCRATAAEISEVARLAGLEASIWTATNETTVVAAAPYLLDELRRVGISFEIVYDSIADYQQALKQNDIQAQEIAAARQRQNPEPRRHSRVALIDMQRQETPQAGYSAWNGDHENFVMQSDRYLAYLDTLTGDDTLVTRQAHLEENYTRHGARVVGFYTLEEFANVAPRFFDGRSFNLSKPQKTENQAASVEPQGAEGKFHNYDETLAEFTILAQANPNIARVVTLGSTYENHQIFALKIGKDPALDDSRKPDVLITGCYHAREWISVEAPIYFAKQLLSKYSTDESIRYIVDHLQIWIVPIVNPDGLLYSQTQPNNLLNDTRLWRKNRRPVTAEGCRSGTGVDLNRNYGFQWRLRGDEPCPNTSDDNGASDDPMSELYRGSEAESELEIKAIKSLIDDPARHFRLQLDYHSFSQLILYPFGYSQDPAPDDSTLATLARKMADEMKKVDGKTYTPKQAQRLYVTTGSSIDYSYGVNRVAVPILVEVRPDCCSFNLPESEIDAVNAETWAGAQVMLNWATDVPILQDVRAYQVASGGTFTKTVYGARWTRTNDGRQFIVDGKTQGLDYGRIQVRLQFSKPMDASAPPRVTMGRNDTFDEISFTTIEATEGWQKTVYQNDTWIGEAIIPQDPNQTTPWRLAITAKDFVSFNLDANPATLAGYGVGTNKWQSYEANDGSGNDGGTDTHHLLPPTAPGDFLNLYVTTPGGGERLAAGDLYTVTWTVPRELGLTPVKQDVYFSPDGGFNYAAYVQNILGNPEKAQITLPRTPTTQGRFRILATEGSLGNIIFGDSRADFTIGVNVGANAEVTFLSSEKINEPWTDISGDSPPITSSGATKLAINLQITNRGNVAIANPFLRVAEVNRGNILLSRDRKSRPGNGAQQSFNAGNDNLLAPGETLTLRLVVGIVSKKGFNLSVSLYGVPVNGSINQGDGFLVWQGKPKTRRG